MRPVSESLKAAAKSLNRKPLQQVAIEDERLRFVGLIDNSETVPDVNGDAVLCGSAIVVAVGSAGNVRVARVTDFTNAAAWRGSALSFSAHRACEPRLWSDGSSRVQVLYVRTDGAVCYRESQDGGTIWLPEQNTGLVTGGELQSCVVGMRGKTLAALRAALNTVSGNLTPCPHTR